MVNKLEMIKFLQGINSPLYDSLQFDDRFNGRSVCLRKEGEESPLASSCFHPFFLLGSKTSSQRKSEQNNNLGQDVKQQNVFHLYGQS